MKAKNFPLYNFALKPLAGWQSQTVKIEIGYKNRPVIHN